MASPTGVTSCKRFTNKYVPVVIGLRANNVRPYGTDCTDRIDTVRRGRRTLRYPFSIKLKRRNIVNRHGNSPFSISIRHKQKQENTLQCSPVLLILYSYSVLYANQSRFTVCS